MPKNRYFPKGIIHRFCPKIEIFLIRVVWRNEVRKYCFLIFWIKNEGFFDQNLKFQEVQKVHIFQRVHGFCPKTKVFLIYFSWIKQVS